VIVILPPLILIALLFFHSETQRDMRHRDQATVDLRRVIAFRDQFRRNLTAAIDSASYSEWYVQANAEIGQSDSARVAVDASAFGLDFLELTDIGDRVVASSIGPWRIGQTVELTNVRQISARFTLSERVERDSTGAHPALVVRVFGDGVVNLYGGFYLDRRFMPRVDSIIRGTTRLILADDSTAEAERCTQMEVCRLTKTGEKYEAVLSGGPGARYFILAEFSAPGRTLVSGWSLALITLAVLASVMVALGVRRYLGQQPKWESDSCRSKPPRF